MSRKDIVLVASRTLALLLIVWTMSEISFLPDRLLSFAHFVIQQPVNSAGSHYLRNYHLLFLSFTVVRIIGFSALAAWLHKAGPGVSALLLPAEPGPESSH